MRIRVFILALALAETGVGASGNRGETLTLENGRVLHGAVWQQASRHGVVFSHTTNDGRALSLIPFAFLTPDMQSRAREDLSHSAAPEKTTEQEMQKDFYEERREEIAANRAAQREAMIAAAKAASSSAPSPRETQQVNPTWNDLELLQADFGLRHAVVRVHNHGQTSRRVENWDFHIVFSDGSTRTPSVLRPNRIPPQSVASISFRVPDLYYHVPRFLRFSRGDDTLLAVDRNVVEVDSRSPRRSFFPRHIHSPHHRSHPRQEIIRQIRRSGAKGQD